MKKTSVFNFYSVAVFCLLVASGWKSNPGISDIHLSPKTLYIVTGSDWCPNCNYLEKHVLSQKAFIDYTNAIDLNVVKIDFPQRIKQKDSLVQINKAYAEKLKFNGEFPSLFLVVKDTGNVVSLPYQKEPVSTFIANLKLYME